MPKLVERSNSIYAGHCLFVLAFPGSVLYWTILGPENYISQTLVASWLPVNRFSQWEVQVGNWLEMGWWEKRRNHCSLRIHLRLQQQLVVTVWDRQCFWQCWATGTGCSSVSGTGGAAIGSCWLQRALSILSAAAFQKHCSSIVSSQVYFRV